MDKLSTSTTRRPNTRSPRSLRLQWNEFYRKYAFQPRAAPAMTSASKPAHGGRTREAADLFFNGTDWTRLVFSYNSTDALNLALFGLLDAGDHSHPHDDRAQLRFEAALPSLRSGTASRSTWCRSTRRGSWTRTR